MRNYEVAQRIMLHEGLRLQPYFCSKGKLTIGVGRCIDTNPISKEEEKVIGDWRHGITKCQAMYLLENDIKRIYKELAEKIDFFRQLDDERKYALVDMAFNMGVNGVMRFKNMLKAMKFKHYEQATQECLNSKYAKEVGIRAVRIAGVIEKGKFIL